jgi:hypothetical protein
MIDEVYYKELDEEFTQNPPDIDTNRLGYFAETKAAAIVLKHEDIEIAKALARRESLSVSEFLSKTLRRELLAVS